jgi:IS30 family transposase
MRYSPVARIGAFYMTLIRVRFLLDIYTSMVHKLMDEKFSISETARLLEVHRGTIRRWIKKGLIPEPIAEDTAGARLRYWNRDGFAKVKEYRDKHFGEGQGRRNDIKKKRIKRTK